MNSTKHKIELFLTDYYQKLDQRAPLKTFDAMIDWDDFQLLTGQVVIRTREEYRDWYLGVRQDYENCQHKLKKLKIEVLDGGMCFAKAKLQFTATKIGFIDSEVEITSKVEWTLVDSEAGLRIKEYVIK